MDNQIYETQSFRLAASLVAHGCNFLGIFTPLHISKKRYVFLQDEFLVKTKKQIETNTDSISSHELYFANDYLSNYRTTSSDVRDYIQAQVNLFGKEVDGDV